MGGGSGPPDTKHGHYLGSWGNLGSQTQKGIVTYVLSPYRQRPLAGAAHAAVFNTWRRFRGQVFYVLPPFVAAYLLMDWAVKENEYFNSKAGRLREREAALAATDGGSVRG